MSRTVRIAPSILSADFGHLARDVQAAEEAGADWIHVDVMDGHFVPNITIGPAVTEAVRKATRLPVDVHLMIEAPERYIDGFVRAGADRITVHQETCTHLHRILTGIREAGARPGVAVNPGTPVEVLRDAVEWADLILIMTVNPGFGGQAFIPESIPRLRRLQGLLAASGREGAVDVQVDGGVSADNARQLAEAGADVLVAGSALFRAEDGLAGAMNRMREAVGQAGVMRA
jgi:ribulose-phosphate 3-epimerase